MMLTRDGIAGLVCLAISIFLLFLTLDLPPAVMVPIGPAFYPRVVLGLVAILSVILLVGDFMGRSRRSVPLASAARTATATPPSAAPGAVSSGEAAPPAASAAPAAVARPNYGLVLATFILFGIYVVILPWLGFRISTFLFVAALQPTLEWPRSWQRWLLVVAVAFATTIACHYVFEDYLSVLLPRGRWSGM